MPSDDFESREALSRALVQRNLDALARGLFEGQPWIFRDEPGRLQDVEQRMRENLKDQHVRLLAAGSAATGFSLAPYKFGQPFSENSDIDFVVVSARLFDKAWTCVRKWAHPRRHPHRPDERSFLRDRTNEVFWGWSMPDNTRLSEGLGSANKLHDMRDIRVRWTNALRGLGASFPGETISRHKASARLYRTKDNAIEYHAESLRRLRRDLAKREAS